MTPALLLPLGLGALATLLIPLVIHIARKTESRTIDFAALRWLEQRAKPRRRLQIDERVLLASRLLLLAVAALWLSRPVLWGVQDDRAVVAILPGLNAAAVGEKTEDSRLIWLSAGFPALGQPAPAAPSNPASLIRQLDAELSPAAPLTVVVPGTLDGLDAERPALIRRVDWRTVGSGALPAAARASPPPALTVRADPDHQGNVRYLSAAATAWAEGDADPAFDTGPTDQRLPSRGRSLVWLAAGPVPDSVADWIRGGGTALLSHDARLDLDGGPTIAWSDARGEALAMAGRLGQGRVVKLTRPLEPASLPELLEPDFPDVLRRLLAPSPAPARALSADHAPLLGEAAYPQPPVELRPWLALILALVFGVERWLATRPARAVAP